MAFAAGGFRWLNTFVRPGDEPRELMRLDNSGNTGNLTLSVDVALNEHALRLRGAADSNHMIRFDSGIDGMQFTAFDRFQWMRANGNTLQMTLRGDGVLLTRGGFNGKCTDLFIGAGVCNQDLAETFRTKEQTEAGDVVTLIPQDHERPTVRRSLRAYDEHLVGVVSTNPGLVFDEGETKLAGANDKFITKEKAPVAAVGRVPVKFTLENGAINVGDSLTSSATEPGKAMKATGAGKIIGMALESSAKAQDSPTKDKLLMWLQVGHYAPPQQGEAVQAVKAENAELKAKSAALETQLNALRQDHQQQLAELKAQLAALAAQLPAAKNAGQR